MNGRFEVYTGTTSFHNLTLASVFDEKRERIIEGNDYTGNNRDFETIKSITHFIITGLETKRSEWNYRPLKL
ncbi:CLUMA_CG007822, isoform A [Clunio marinus]|uniref:CLUMA_CG007822, isoform A n=1 Tax=Clunio marinus TaxID=568069 RepID=A0A1J1I271_9DIPT|nr:CLUMA_CG007822, isoform A [Clunio marinus]